MTVIKHECSLTEKHTCVKDSTLYRKLRAFETDAKKSERLAGRSNTGLLSVDCGLWSFSTGTELDPRNLLLIFHFHFYWRFFLINKRCTISLDDN